MKIDSDIPPPRNIYPFSDMQPGDSFVTDRPAVRAAANVWAKRKGMKFITRTVEDGVRVWRVE